MECPEGRVPDFLVVSTQVAVSRSSQTTHHVEKRRFGTEKRV